MTNDKKLYYTGVSVSVLVYGYRDTPS